MALSPMTNKNWWLSSDSLYFNQSVRGGGGGGDSNTVRVKSTPSLNSKTLQLQVNRQQVFENTKVKISEHILPKTTQHVRTNTS